MPTLHCVSDVAVPPWPGAMFPARFQGSVFIAQHGSWARSQRIGYRVGVVALGAGHRTSVGYDSDFLTGFLLPNNTIWVLFLLLQDGIPMRLLSVLIFVHMQAKVNKTLIIVMPAAPLAKSTSATHPFCASKSNSWHTHDNASAG